LRQLTALLLTTKLTVSTSKYTNKYAITLTLVTQKKLKSKQAIINLSQYMYVPQLLE